MHDRQPGLRAPINYFCNTYCLCQVLPIPRPDPPISAGMNYRRTKEYIMKDVKHDAWEWRDKEPEARVKTCGSDKGTITKKLDVDTKNWIDLEFQRRMNWNYEEESTEPLE